jgi:hypothetical protein
VLLTKSLADARRLRDRAQAASANVYSLWLSINLNRRALDIRLEHAICLVVRVADFVTEPRSLATHITFTGHTGPLYFSKSCLSGLHIRLMRQGILRARKHEE